MLEGFRRSVVCNGYGVIQGQCLLRMFRVFWELVLTAMSALFVTGPGPGMLTIDTNTIGPLRKRVEVFRLYTCYQEGNGNCLHRCPSLTEITQRAQE